jgi:hypothetical protein
MFTSIDELFLRAVLLALLIVLMMDPVFQAMIHRLKKPLHLKLLSIKR